MAPWMDRCPQMATAPPFPCSEPHWAPTGRTAISSNSDQCNDSKNQAKGEFTFPNTSSLQLTLASVQAISQPSNEAPGNEMIESLCYILFPFPKNRCALYHIPLYHLKSSY